MEIIYLDNQTRDIPIFNAITKFPFYFYLVCVHSQDKSMLLYKFVVRHFQDNTIILSLYYCQSSPYFTTANLLLRMNVLVKNGLGKIRQEYCIYKIVMKIIYLDNQKRMFQSFMP